MDLLQSLLENPFYKLESTPQNTREELINQQGVMALFGNHTSSQKALFSLLNPQTRLEAELRWFPNTDSEAVRKFIEYLKSEDPDTTVPSFETTSFLSKFNQIRLLLYKQRVLSTDRFIAVMYSLATVADTLLPGQVMAEINKDRILSGFPKLDNDSEIDTALEGFIHETVSAFLEYKTKSYDSFADLKKLTSVFKDAYTKKSSPLYNSYLMETAADELIGVSRTDLDSCRKKSK